MDFNFWFIDLVGFVKSSSVEKAVAEILFHIRLEKQNGGCIYQ
jgi:hypothetical protein